MGPDRRGPPRDFRSAQKGELHPKSCACEQRRQRSERCRPLLLPDGEAEAKGLRSHE